MLNHYSFGYELVLKQHLSVVEFTFLMPESVLGDMALARHTAKWYISNDAVSADLPNYLDFQ